MSKDYKELIGHLSAFMDLIEARDFDVGRFLDFMGQVFSSEDICIMQVNRDLSPGMLCTLFTNPRTLKIPDAEMNRDLDNVIRDSRFVVMPATVCGRQFVEHGIERCIVGPIDVVKTTDELLVVGTHDANREFDHDDVLLAKMLSFFLSMRFVHTADLRHGLLERIGEFRELLSGSGLNVDGFLSLLSDMLNAEDVCIMQLDQQDGKHVLTTIYSNSATPPLDDIPFEKGTPIDEAIAEDKALVLETGAGPDVPKALLDQSIVSCIVSPIDVVRTTQELLVAGTHKNDVRFTTEDAIIVEALCEFLSMKFRENELFNESQVLEEAGTYGYSLTLNDLRALNIDSRFLRDIHRHIVKHEIARRVVVAELEIFRQRSDLQTGTKGRVSIMDIQSRTKVFASIVEKMRRKRRHYSTFDDIAGVRIIVDYLGDISKVVDFIHHNKRFSICEEEDKISSPDETTRYRGYHITVQLGIELNDGTEDLAKCELQIRTTYQDSWSRKAHQLTYKKSTIPDNLRSLLALLSDQLYNADQQSEILRKSIEQTT